MPAEALKKFGKYFLLDLIAQGGMAEIYRARMATLDGGGRLLAVKRIIGNYSENREFVEMFKSEIKTTSGFTHPNIVQLYDYGEEDGVLFIAMELVDGKNLRQFMSRFVELKQPFPIEVAVFIMEQAAHGMAYAHSYKDKITGKPLNLVHRDISPQNLLISYDGAVKVIDFGIAKAATNVESTRAGVIKGKPSYLSPEQISGETLDGRSDIFALGIVLWEMLTGKKLFASDNDYGVLKLIENCHNTVRPPSMFNPKVPKDLDAIVMKTLQKNRDNRYSSAEEMQRALHKFLYQFAPEFNPADLAYYARDLFKNEIVEDRKRLLRLNEKVETLLSQPAPAPAPAPAAAAPAPAPAAAPAAAPPAPAAAPAPAAPAMRESTVALDAAEKSKPAIAVDTPSPISVAKKSEDSLRFRTLDLGKEKSDVEFERPTSKGTPTTKGGPAQPAQPGKIQFATSSTSTSLKRRATNSALKRPEAEKKPPAAAIAAAAALIVLGYLYDPTLFGLLGNKPTEKAQPAAVAKLTITSNVSIASVSINGEKKAESLPAILNVPAGQPLNILVFSNGYKKGASSVTLNVGEDKTVAVPLELENVQANVPQPTPGREPATPAQDVTLRVSVKPDGVGNLIRVNNAVVDATGVVQVGTEKPIELIVERDGFRTYKEVFTLHESDFAGKSRELAKEVSLVQAKFGYVSIHTTPTADAVLTIDGNEEHWPTPVSRRRVPVGTYDVKLVNTLLGMEKRVTITVTEDRFTSIDERLEISGNGGGAPQQRAPTSQ